MTTITTKKYYSYSIQTDKGLSPYSEKYNSKEEAEDWLRRYRLKVGFTLRGSFVFVEETKKIIDFS